MRLKYNSPVILTFTLFATAILVLDTIFGNAMKPFVTVGGTFSFSDPLQYVTLVTHILGHADWGHLVGNFSLILLIGPILEEKYGSSDMLFMIGITALLTGIFNIVLFDSGLLGASGIVFMLILLSSMTNFEKGSIPITFVLVVLLFLGKEIYSAVTVEDGISQFAHIFGGVCGSIFGYFSGKGKPAPVA